MKVLLVGGTHDGEWVEVTDPRGHIPIIKKYQTQTVSKLPQLGEDIKPAHFQYEYYHSTAWFIHQQEDPVYIYGIEGMQPKQVFYELMSGYRTPPKATKA